MRTNSYVVYPRLSSAVARKMINEIRSMSVEELRTKSSTHHESVVYAPTGNKIQQRELEQIQELIRECATDYGYPQSDNTDQDQARDFDAACAKLMHQRMSLQPSEAAHIEMWIFMACVLLPDIVRWRYPGESTAEERFIGSNRGLRRNTLGRLWWRAYLLYDPAQQDPYELIPQLNEDDYAALMERSSIAVNPVLVTAASRAFIAVAVDNPDLTRRDIVREAAKRIRRLLSFVSYEAMDADAVQNAMDNIFKQTVEAIRTSSIT